MMRAGGRFHRWVDDRARRRATPEQIEAAKSWSATRDYLLSKGVLFELFFALALVVVLVVIAR